MQKNKKRSLFYRLAEWMALRSGLHQDLQDFLTETFKDYDKKQLEEYSRFKRETSNSYLRAIKADKKLIKELNEQNVQLQSQLNKFEHQTHQNMSYNMDLQFLEANCDKPLLWVCGDPAMHNSGSFGRVMDKLRKICPKVDMVVFTPHGTEIQEMDDEDLFKVGLVRIRLDRLTPKKTKQLKEWVDGLPESKLLLKGA